MTDRTRTKAATRPADDDWLAGFFDEPVYQETPVDAALLRLPPGASGPAVPMREQVARDLSAFRKAWGLHGEGNSGKTLLARLMGGELLARGQADSTILAALAPANRNLTWFFQRVMQPESSDTKVTAAFAQRLLSGLAKRGMHGILDFGGGDAAWAALVRAMPALAETYEPQGLAVIAAYVLTPRLADLGFLTTYSEMGYRPSAEALILNLWAAGDDPSVFAPMRQHPVYKAALDRGAVEIWLPTLDRKLSGLIERNMMHFRQAMEGVVPEGSKAPVFGPMDRMTVRDWHTQTLEAFAPVATWMPWEGE